MNSEPILSIVVPTAGKVSEAWLAELLKVRGDVEFILCFPPRSRLSESPDPRLKQIVCPKRGEVIQRLTALFEARGTYVLSLNCDELVHPDIADLAVNYFSRFPESWVLRLARKDFASGDVQGMSAAWPGIPELEGSKLSAVPIAPLRNRFDPLVFFRGRKDQQGRHIENFDKKIWRNDLVREAIKDLKKTMGLDGPFKWVPFWALDRLLGLFIQAKFFRPGIMIGHCMPQSPEQIRIEDNPPERKRGLRFYVAADILLLKRFPQYGYFWNLVLDQLWAIPKRAVAHLWRKILRHHMKGKASGRTGR